MVAACGWLAVYAVWPWSPLPALLVLWLGSQMVPWFRRLSHPRPRVAHEVSPVVQWWGKGQLQRGPCDE